MKLTLDYFVATDGHVNVLLRRDGTLAAVVLYRGMDHWRADETLDEARLMLIGIDHRDIAMESKKKENGHESRVSQDTACATTGAGA